MWGGSGYWRKWKEIKFRKIEFGVWCQSRGSLQAVQSIIACMILEVEEWCGFVSWEKISLYDPRDPSDIHNIQDLENRGRVLEEKSENERDVKGSEGHDKGMGVISASAGSATPEIDPLKRNGCGDVKTRPILEVVLQRSFQVASLVEIEPGSARKEWGGMVGGKVKRELIWQNWSIILFPSVGPIVHMP
jgi:hypothetical protein